MVTRSLEDPHTLTSARNYETLTTTKGDVLAMVVGRPAHSGSPTLAVVLASNKTTIPALANQPIILEVGFSASLLPHLLLSGQASLPRLASEMAVSLVLNSPSQLRLAYLELRRLLSQVRISSVLREIVRADLGVAAALVARSAQEEEEACLGTTISNSNRSLGFHSTILLPQADSDKVIMPLAPHPPQITMLVEVSSAIRMLRPTLHSGKRNSSQLRPIRLAALASRRTKLKTVLPRHLVDLGNRSNKTRRLEDFLAPSSRIPIPEAFLGTLAKTTASSSLLAEVYLGIMPIIRLRPRCLHPNQQLQVEVSLGTPIRPVRIPEGDCSGTWETTTPTRPSKTKVVACLEMPSRISKSPEDSLEIRRTLEAASSAI